MPDKKRSEFIASEDWWAIWIGFFLIIIGALLFLPNPPENTQEVITEENAVLKSESRRAPFKTVEWYEASDRKEKVKATNTDLGSQIKSLLGKPKEWKSNPLRAFYMSEETARKIAAEKQEKLARLTEKAAEMRSQALAAQHAAAAEDFSDKQLNEYAKKKIGQWRDAKMTNSAFKKSIPESGYSNYSNILLLGILLAILFGVGVAFMGGSFGRFVAGFYFVYILAAVSYLIAHQSLMSEYGLGYALWAILIGLIISNTVGTPSWVEPAALTEYFIKTGLVLLGAEVLFGKIIQIGIPGLFVAWIVTPVVIVSSFIFGRKIVKVKSDELNITMSAAVSVCGVSAAIATAAACKAKKEELTLAVGLSLIFTAIMMVVMPAFIKAVGMAEILGGAWMGGVIDSTGAVAAAGAFLGEKALYVSATIKMIQNILIGLVAFIVAIYWTMKMQRKAGQKPNAMEIWYRFPKFVIGFALASVAASIISSTLGSDMSYVVVDHGIIRGFTKNLRGWMFALAFVSIGLSTNFRQLRAHLKGGKPFTLYVFGQSFNLFLTLLIAWIAFYLLFPAITEAI
jgi:uncharacterized membrane protein YadS